MKRRHRTIACLLGMGTFLFASTPFAAETALDSGDTAWMMISTMLVLFMFLPGLGLFNGGMVQQKNVYSMLSQTFAAVSVAAVVWVAIGYSLTFSEGNSFIGGFGKAFSLGEMGSVSGTIPEKLFAAFQMTFYCITIALVFGSLAERMKFSATLLFALLWGPLVYAPIAHSVWGPGGWLVDKGILDFAGGTVVHINSGIAGLVGAIVIGRRLRVGPPHNLVLTFTGGCMLAVGWIGFNAGSALAANASAAAAVVVTIIAAMAGAFSWMVVEYAFRYKPSLLGMISGAIAGLVAITPASGFVDEQGALIIGGTAGIVCCWAVSFLKRWVDDALDVFGIHGIGGIVGAMLTGVFAMESVGGTPGALEGNTSLLGVQTLGVVSTIAYSAIMTAIIIKVIDLMVGLRVPRQVEIQGLDFHLHGETLGATGEGTPENEAERREPRRPSFSVEASHQTE